MNGLQDAVSRLRQRVRIECRVLVDAGDGQFDESWSHVATVWAAVEPVESRLLTVERVVQEQHVSAPMFRITLRFRDDVTADMRLVYDGRLFNIRSVVSPGERREMLVLLAEENVAT